MGHKPILYAGACLAALLNGGCARELTTLPDLTRTKSKAEAMAGIAYNLPMLQYDLVVTRTLATCPKIVPATAKQPRAYDATLAFEISVAATPHYVRGESYVVDYRSLASPLKTSDFTLVPYATTGNLKSINVSAEDHTGDVLKDAAKVVLSVATLAGGGPLTALPAVAGAAFDGPSDKGGGVPAEVRTIVCTSEAEKLVAKVAAQSQAIEKATDLLETKTRAVEEIALVVPIRGLSAEAKDRYAARLAKAFQEQAAAQQALKSASAEKEKLATKLTVTTKYTWPERIDDVKAKLEAAKAIETFEPLLEPKHRPLATAPAGADPVPDTCKQGTPNIHACLVATLTLGADLRTVERVGQKYVSDTQCPSEKDKKQLPSLAEFPTLDCRKSLPPRSSASLTMRQRAAANVVNARSRDASGSPLAMPGVFVRQPVPGHLFVCRGDTEGCAVNDVENLFAPESTEKPTIAPQLGQLRFLPFRNRVFQSNELVLELGEDGSITKFGYKDKVAQAATLAAASADIAKQIETQRTTAREERAKQQAAGLAKIQAEIDVLTKTAELAKLRAPADPARTALSQQTTDIQAEVALLNAKLAREQTRQSLLAAGVTLD